MDNKRTAIIAVIVVVALVASGMYVLFVSNNKDENETSAITVTDALDHNVTLNSTPLTVVSCTPSITELLYSLGVNNTLVGVTSYCDYPLNDAGKAPNELYTTIGGYWEPSFETISGLDPDLVIIDASVGADTDLIAQLNSVGIKYLALYPGENVAQIEDNIHLLGQVFEKQSAANSLVDQMSERLSAITESVANQTDRPSVMIMVSYDSGVMVCGGSTFISDIITAAGGVNAFANLSGYKTVTKEAVVEANPDIIIITGSMITGETTAQFLNDVCNDSLLKSTNAVVNGNVYILQNQGESAFLRQSTRVVQATQLMADILYPTLFNTTIPKIIGNDYTNYLPASWNVTSTGADTVMASMSW